MTNRRNFVKALGAVGFAGSGVQRLAAEISQFGEPDLRIGIVSDAHVKALPGDDVEKSFSANRLKKVLEYFRSRHVDGVLVAGDITDKGLVVELEHVAKVWFDVFPDNKLPDGSPVANLMHMGDHDAELRFWKEVSSAATKAAEVHGLPPPLSLAVGDYRKSEWERLFKEPWTPVMVRKVKGYTFVLSNFMREEPGANSTLAVTLAGAEIDPSKPFFYSQHRPFSGTRLAKWGPDAGKNLKVLADYPNAVAFLGHTHYTLVDDKSLWQRECTAINTGALESTAPDWGSYENGVTVSWYPKDPMHDSQMECTAGRRNANMGWVMSVYGGRIVLERRDFNYGCTLGDDLAFDVDIPARRKRIDTSAARAARSVAPQFLSGAKVTVKPGPGKDRKGRPVEQLAVVFPTVLSAGRAKRAYDYRVRAYAADGMLLKEKLVFSPGLTLPEKLESKESVCVFACHEIAGGENVRFTVEPRDCWGNAGRAISNLS